MAAEVQSLLDAADSADAETFLEGAPSVTLGVDHAAQSTRSYSPGSDDTDGADGADESRRPVPERVGKFVIREFLGSGGFGSVYLAEDSVLHRDVAVKVPKSGSLRSEREIEKFIDEARSAASLAHPGIVAVYEAGRLDDDGCYIAYAFVDGEPLRPTCAGPGLRTRRRCACWRMSPTPSIMRICVDSFTATSSPRTSSSTSRNRSASPISDSQFNRTRSISIAVRWRARGPTWRPNRFGETSPARWSSGYLGPGRDLV